MRLEWDVKSAHLRRSGGHGHVIRSDGDFDTLFQVRAEVQRLRPLLTRLLSGAPGNKHANKQTNG